MQSPPAITINDYNLDSDHQFVYLGSTITDNLSLDTEINKRVRKAATTLTHPTSHVWSNFKLTVKTKMVCTMPAFLAPYMYYMAARHGPHTCMPDRKRGSTPST